MSKPGCFMTLEGIDGAGKSTHLAWLTERIKATGIDLVVTREPGGTALGEELRQMVLQKTMQPDTELMLVFAARREHLEQLIWPALAAGKWVLCDRFTDATYAYQGSGRGLDIKRIEALESWTHVGFQPDLTWFFDLPAALAEQRRQDAARTASDRFEQEQTPFFERVRQGYWQRVQQDRAARFSPTELLPAGNDQGRFRIIDASQSIRAIQTELARHLNAFLPRASQSD